MPPHLLQEVLRKQLFADPTQWWDNSRNKPCLPDSEHEAARVVLWLNNRQKLGWVDSPLNATIVPDTRVDSTTNAQSEPLSVQGRGGGLPAREGQQLDLGKCVKLCEDGRTSDAVDALHLMVEQGCHVPSNLYYRLLKSCIKDKDLGLGRRIHALTIKSGYEGDPFLATHLIGMYASHRRLEEAMRVFTQVRTPDAYNWATIIFAYATHGQPAEAVEAIRLYRQMCQSATVEPDDRICLAVVKACATAQDMVAGKEGMPKREWVRKLSLSGGLCSGKVAPSPIP